MRLVIGAIGHLKRGPDAELFNDYVARAQGPGRSLGFKGPDIVECDVARAMTGQPRMDAEADLLTRQIGPSDSVFILDERGKAMSSRGFATSVDRLKDDGSPQCWFLIGGADGHGAAVNALMQSGKAHRVSFGPATWPHMLVRVMLAEQLYRAITILAGHPYHRD